MGIKMDKSGILFISPHYPPHKSGLADYSHKFVEKLKEHRPVRVLSDNEVKGWKGFPLLKTFWELCMCEEETLLIQYVPYMYGRRGLNLQFPILLFILSLFKRKRIQLMVHEYNYPCLGDFKSCVLYSFHQIMGKILLLSSDDVFCTTRHFKEYLEQKCFRPVCQLPVGSNIIKSSNGTEALTKFSLNEDSYLCLFGKFHPSKNLEFILKYLEGTDQRVVHIGASENDYKEKFGSTPSHITPTGFLEEPEVSALLQKSKLLMTYFVDGATLRRGSLLAGVENGTPILTNWSENTEAELMDCSNIYFAYSNSAYLKMLKELSTASKRDFSHENPFSWDNIVRRYLAHCVGR